MSVLPSPLKSPTTTYSWPSGSQSIAQNGLVGQSWVMNPEPVDSDTRHAPHWLREWAMSVLPSPLKSPTTTFSWPSTSQSRVQNGLVDQSWVVKTRSDVSYVKFEPGRADPAVMFPEASTATSLP